MATKRALAISGGGLHGSFAVGVILELDKRGVNNYDIVSGTSTGSLIAPMVLLGDFDRVRDAYGSADTASVYKKYSELDLAIGVLGDLISGKLTIPSSLGSMAPLRKKIEENLTENDWERLLKLAKDEKKELYLATVDLVTGAVVYWTLPGPRSSPGVHRRIIGSRERLIDVMIASSTIPFAAKPVMMPDDRAQHPHVDGGVRDELPAWICVERGATELYAIVIQQDGIDRKEGPFTSGQSIIKRVVSLLTFEGRSDTVRALQAAAGFADYKRALAAAVADIPGAADRLGAVEVPDVFKTNRLEKLLIIRPSEALPGGTLDATSDEMKEMIAIGRKRADDALDFGTPFEPLLA